jgi:hypothetical protein
VAEQPALAVLHAQGVAAAGAGWEARWAALPG